MDTDPIKPKQPKNDIKFNTTKTLVTKPDSFPEIVEIRQTVLPRKKKSKRKLIRT